VPAVRFRADFGPVAHWALIAQPHGVGLGPMCLCSRFPPRLVRMFSAMVLLGMAPWVQGADPFPGTVPGTEIGGGLPSGFEPSGAAWDPVRGQLYVCSDGGRVARMNSDGSSLLVRTVAGDLEGVAIVTPGSDFVFVVNEATAQIIEVNFSTGAVTRTFSLLTATPGQSVPALSAGDLDALQDGGDGDGAEALAFVPDNSDPEGGLFFVGSQENGTIYKFRLSLSSGTTVTYEGKFKTWPSNNNDLSGLEYDWTGGARLLAVWDNQDVIRVITPIGGILREWDMPSGSNDEEGLGFDGSNLFIAEDPSPASQVWRYSDFGAAVPVGLTEFAVE
jgi:DNA-binding beta-propeller fold protein YncE